MQRLAYGTGNRRSGVRIPSERHGVPDRSLEACGFERADKRRRHRALAGDVEPNASRVRFVRSVCLREYAIPHVLKRLLTGRLRLTLDEGARPPHHPADDTVVAFEGA